HEQRVKRVAVPVHQVHQRGWRPDRVLEVGRVGDDQTLQVNDVRDEREVHDEEDDEYQIGLAFPQGHSVHAPDRGGIDLAAQWAAQPDVRTRPARYGNYRALAAISAREAASTR